MYCNEGGEAGAVQTGDEEKARRLLEAADARRGDATDHLHPPSLRKRPSAELAALRSMAVPAALPWQQLAGRYANTKGGAWREVEVRGTEDATWPLQPQFQAMQVWLQWNETTGFCAGWVRASEWLSITFGVVPDLVNFNTSEMEVYGVYLLLDDMPIRQHTHSHPPPLQTPLLEVHR